MKKKQSPQQNTVIHELKKNTTDNRKKLINGRSMQHY